MLRLRFSSGLILGLVVGVLAGLVIGMLMLPTPKMDTAVANSQVIELTRKLEVATEAKERADRQLEQFQKLADQMTTTFKSLEQRFNALEEAQRARQGQPPPAGQPEAKAAAPQPTPAPPAPATPTVAPSTSDAAAPTIDEGEREDSSDRG